MATETNQIETLLKECKQVTIIVPRAADSAEIPVCINGYTYRVPRGIAVEVPEPVAKIIMESYDAIEQSDKNMAMYTAGGSKPGKKVQ